MTVKISSRFAFELDQPTDILLQFEAAAIPEQAILSADTQMSDAEHCARVPAQDSIGERIWVRANGEFRVEYEAEVQPNRVLPDLASLGMIAPHELPGEAVQYLLDSRYCPADRFQPFVEAEFGGTLGGERVEAIRAWIADHFDYVPGASDPSTDAVDSFVMRQGICRDYAHVAVTLARASGIPARYVACYAPGVTPQDFHAVAEMFLDDPSEEHGGTWQLVDATGMAEAAQIAKIGVGRDAADVSFLTSFGPNRFQFSEVDVSLA